MRTKARNKLEDKMIVEYRCNGACKLGRSEGELHGRLQVYYEMGLRDEPPPKYERTHYARLLKYYERALKRLVTA